MTLERVGIGAHLQTRAALVALIGDRAYPRRLPQNATLPAIVYRRIGPTDRALSQSGPVDLVDARFQFDVWAADPDTADAVAEQLRLVLHGYAGAMGGVAVGVSRVVNDVDEDEPTTGLYRRILDAQIQHAEAIA